MVTVRPATHKDMGFLVRVLLLANIERCQKQKGWNAEESLESVRFSTTDELQGRTQDSTTYVIAADGEDVGRLRVVRTGSHLLIAGIQILPDHQRKGIGATVIRSLLHEGQAAHLPVTLEVEQDNTNAKRLYLRLGFVVTGERGDRFCMTASIGARSTAIDDVGS